MSKNKLLPEAEPEAVVPSAASLKAAIAGATSLRSAPEPPPRHPIPAPPPPPEPPPDPTLRHRALPPRLDAYERGELPQQEQRVFRVNHGRSYTSRLVDENGEATWTERWVQLFQANESAAFYCSLPSSEFPEATPVLPMEDKEICERMLALFPNNNNQIAHDVNRWRRLYNSGRLPIQKGQKPPAHLFSRRYRVIPSPRGLTLPKDERALIDLHVNAMVMVLSVRGKFLTVLRRGAPPQWTPPDRQALAERRLSLAPRPPSVRLPRLKLKPGPKVPAPREREYIPVRDWIVLDPTELPVPLPPVPLELLAESNPAPAPPPSRPALLPRKSPKPKAKPTSSPAHVPEKENSELPKPYARVPATLVSAWRKLVPGSAAR